MKKYLGIILLCIGIIFQGNCNVLASEVPTIKIEGIKQGSNWLEKEGEAYLVTGFEYLHLYYDVENYDGENDYYLKTIVDNSYGGTGRYYGQTDEIVTVPYNKEIVTYSISLCSDWDCNEVLTSDSIEIKLAYYDEIKDNALYVTKVMQGEKEVKPDEYGQLKLNDKEDIILTIKGMNLIDDLEYTLSTYWSLENNEYLGSELEEGIELFHPTNIYDTVSLNFRVDEMSFSLPTYYYDGENVSSLRFSYNEDENIPNIESKLIYTNYDNIDILESDDEYSDVLIVNSRYHNENNPLAYQIKGTNYLDRDYKVKVQVLRYGEVIYTSEDNVNGLLLNEGYNYELEDLVMELETKIEEGDIYIIYLSVGSISTKNEVKYNSVGKDARVNAGIFYENGIKNLSAFRGNGSYYFSGGIYDTNIEVFSKYSYVYLHFLGNNFDDNTEYQYVLDYGYFIDGMNSAKTYEKVLTTGNIKGRILNNVGALFQVNNPSNYENPTYRFTVKQGDEVIYSSSPVLYIVDSPTLANVRLSANNKSLYLRTDDYSYIATRNSQLDIALSGLGFEENTNYSCNFCHSSKKYDNEFHGEQKCNEVDFNGKDINNGNAKITFDKEITNDIEQYQFVVMCSGGAENVALQGMFNVNFVDVKDLISKVVNYTLDNISDLIRDIKKNTSIEDFTSNIEVTDNGKVKVYDKTGTTEIDDEVGTGMIARVMDEFNQSLLDLDVVVKGDVTGDGNISVTDLVNVKQHLAEDKMLEGVYETAGDLEGKGEISITDLVRMAKDVAEIEEIQ